MADYTFTISLDGIARNDDAIIAIEVMRREDIPTLIGYAPATQADWPDAKPGELEIDDIHDSLVLLCDDYGIDVDAVIARMSDMIGAAPEHSYG